MKAAAGAVRFKSPGKSLGHIDAETAANLIAATADVALVMDRKGVIEDIAVLNEELSAAIGGKWLGKSLLSIVTVESRPKVEALLRDAGARTAPRWRQINHPTPKGTDLPVVYSAVQLGEQGTVVAVGRDLRAVAALQQRLIEAEQSMEREYLKLRNAETRYRLLFQIASEAVLIVDATTQRIAEANPAALQLLAAGTRRLVGRSFPDGFEADSAQAIQTHLATVRAAGRANDVNATSADGERKFVVSSSLFRQDAATYFLVRVAPLLPDGVNPAGGQTRSKLLTVLESSPDALVVTDLDGRVLTVNRAFLELAQIASEEQARGESLEKWLGRPGVDLNVLLANLRQHGSVRLFSTSVRGEFGSTADVEISAVSVPNGDPPCAGFTIRNVGRRAAPAPRSSRELPRSVEQLTELVGRVSLKDLVRETTDVIERLCIEAALELTEDNRASAAEMLGLSRQSLYVKLRRYGLVEANSEESEGAS